MAVLKAKRRDQVGTRAARRLREKGDIPAILYGHGEEVVALTLQEHDVEMAVQHGERMLEVDLEGESHNALIKEIQYDTFEHEILHVDLTRVNLDERVEVTVPITLRGTPAGAEEGGVLRQNAVEVEVECVVTAIPEEIRVNVNELKIGDSIQIGDLELPEGARLLSDPDMPVCSVSVIAEEEEEAVEGEAEGAEPEVIGEKPAEEEAAESE